MGSEPPSTLGFEPPTLVSEPPTLNSRGQCVGIKGPEPRAGVGSDAKVVGSVRGTGEVKGGNLGVTAGGVT
eukprot:1386119-Amorphochlora_amoeboformis.AAC.2